LKYRVEFRTARFSRERLPNLPKSGRLTGFASGLAVGAVAAVTIFGGAPPPAGTAVAFLDVTRSMADYEESVNQHLARLKRSGIAPFIVRTTGVGLTEQGDPRKLLQSFKTVLEGNPAIGSVYVFSDYHCDSPDFDYSDAAGRQEFLDLIQRHRIHLYLAQLKGNHPEAGLFAIASKAGGEARDEDGRRVDTAATNQIFLQGVAQSEISIDKDHPARVPLANATLTAAGNTWHSNGDGHHRLIAKNVPEHFEVAVSTSDGVSLSGKVDMQGCQFVDGVPLLPKMSSGEVAITLAWDKTEGPEDLDLHFTGPNKLHVYFDGTNRNSPPVSLDYDNADEQDGKQLYLPFESMHVRDRLPAGRYQLTVCDFRGERGNAGISRSKASVRVYDHTGLVRSFTVAPNGAGRAWTVFDWDTRGSGEVTGVNSFGDGRGVCVFEKR